MGIVSEHILTCAGTGSLAQAGLGLLLLYNRDGKLFPFPSGKARAAVMDVLGSDLSLEVVQQIQVDRSSLEIWYIWLGDLAWIWYIWHMGI